MVKEREQLEGEEKNMQGFWRESLKETALKTQT
jgi:hypothetical protein